MQVEIRKNLMEAESPLRICQEMIRFEKLIRLGDVDKKHGFLGQEKSLGIWSNYSCF